VHGGIENATMLDYFYLVERLRRWGTTGERSGVVSPLLIPSFVRAAFALDPAQRVDNVLHRELVGRLVPEWADIPFFKPTRPTRPRRSTQQVRCLADAADREVFEQLLKEVDGFDPRALSTLWAASAAGASSAAGEATLRQALWRAAFDNHLAHVNRYLPAVRSEPRGQVAAGRTDAPSGGDGSGSGRLVRRLVRHPGVRWLARTSAWRMFRRSALGRTWRSLGG
jgi:hypothetical protein